jgi:hypothetical protein
LPPVDDDAARRVLGVGRGSSLEELRAAYRTALRRAHPDHAGAGDAADSATRDVVAAYRLLTERSAAPPPPPPATSAPHAAPPPASGETSISVDGDTVVAELPAGDLFPMLVAVAERLGDVTHVEPESDLLEFLVELPRWGTCSVLLSLQGRATGVTEAWCTVEPLRGGPPPPAEEVATLLAAGMRAALGSPR